MTDNTYTFLSTTTTLQRVCCNHCHRISSGSISTYIQCTSCLVTYYCCSEHQQHDSISHNDKCQHVKSSREEVKTEKENLLKESSESGRNLFETHKGLFNKDLTETVNYMVARQLYFASLTTIGVQSSYIAVEFIKENLSLSREDGLGYRYFLGFLLLNLDRDQECYDVIKWYATVQYNHNDWRNINLPFLNLHMQDIYEPSTFIMTNTSPFYKIAILFVKIRLLIQLRQHEAFLAFLLSVSQPTAKVYRLNGNLSILRNIYEFQSRNYDLLPLGDFFCSRTGGLSHTRQYIEDQVFDILNNIRVSYDIILKKIARFNGTVKFEIGFANNTIAEQDSYYILLFCQHILKKSPEIGRTINEYLAMI